ncbi:MAG: DUF2029 domain-containing protein [Acidobacteria bacterium]|nr:DUF2029 domain-containing protein [Acidobacteriota bacterium]
MSKGAQSGERFSFLLLAVLLVAGWTGLGSVTYNTGKYQDFLNIYTGARLARDGQWAQMHDPALQLRYEQQVVPDRKVLVPFVRPHAYALLLMPLSALPHGTAFWVWLGLQAAIAVAVLWWAARRFGKAALLGGLAFPGLWIGILFGQDPSILLATAAAGWVLAEKGRHRAAGFVWGLGLVKFHLLLGLAAGLLLGRKWKPLQGFALAGLALAAIGLLLGGVEGSLVYYRMLTNPNLTGLSPGAEMMTNLQALAANLHLSRWWFYLPAGLAAAACLALALRGGELWRWYGASMVCGLWLAPHIYAYDASILLPAFWLGMTESRSRWPLVAAALYLAPVAIWFNLAGPPWSMANSALLLHYLVSLGLTANRRES